MSFRSFLAMTQLRSVPIRRWASLLLAQGLIATALPAQAGLSLLDNAMRASGTRGELVTLADSLDRVIQAMAPSDRRRAATIADRDVQLQRLQAGDLRVGDRLLVKYSADFTRTDTVTVSPTLGVTIAGLPEIPVRGVLFSELEAYLQGQIDRYVRNARITAAPLMSIGVLGSVSRPGYYLLPHTATITDALMASGGPIAEADASGVRLQHGGRDRWSRNQMIAAMQSQLSLTTLGATDGDVLIVGRQAPPIDRTFLFAAAGLVLQLVLTFTVLRGGGT